jgi:ABC-type amino acid transport substrate-binding protein
MPAELALVSGPKSFTDVRMKTIARLLTIFILCMLILVPCHAETSDRPSGLNDQSSKQVTAPKIVKVGGYDFPPYVEEESGKFTGLAIDFIEMLNAFQSRYRFQFVPTSSMRRYKDFEEGLFDVILFESVDWGWKDLPVDVSKVFAHDSEVFVAKARPGRTQTYFKDLKGKSLQVYLGYHYPFAHYNADPKYLLSEFNARTTVSHEANIRSVLADRSDLAVVTSSYLQKFLRDHPGSIPKLLVANKIEQSYAHTMLVRKHIDPSIAEINGLLDQMQKAGYTSILLGKYGIEQPRSQEMAESDQAPQPETQQVPHGSQVAVKVGGYHFPPYVEHRSGKFKGLTLDLIKLMNAFQSRYRFAFVPTTPVTRYKDFDEGTFDVAFFERKEWGWQDRPLVSSREFLRDAEIYLSATSQGRTQHYFDDLEGKSLVGYVGYHYPITNFQTDPALLLQRYNMRVTASHTENIKSVLDGQVDIAIVTRSFAIRYLRNHPAYIPRVLISEKVVQEYRHTILARETSEPILHDIMGILAALNKAGYSSLLWGKYDLTTIPESP